MSELPGDPNLPPGVTHSMIDDHCSDIPDGVAVCPCGVWLEMQGANRRDLADGSEEFLCSKCAQSFTEHAFAMWDFLFVMLQEVVANVDRTWPAEQYPTRGAFAVAHAVLNKAKWPHPKPAAVEPIQPTPEAE